MSDEKGNNQRDNSGHVAPATDGNGAAKDGGKERHGSKAAGPEGWSFFFECVVTGAAVVGAIFVWLQLESMKESNRITREALEFTKQSAKDSATDVARALDISDRAARAAERAAGATEKAAGISEGNLQTIKNSARLDQRAWVAVIESLKPIFTEGQPVRVGVWLKNVGRTPAVQVKTHIALSRLLPGEIPDFQYPKVDPTTESISVVQPQVQVTSSVVTPWKADATLLGQLRDRAIIPWVYGRIEYRDVFGLGHTTTFCMTFERDLENMDWCGRYNTAN